MRYFLSIFLRPTSPLSPVRIGKFAVTTVHQEESSGRNPMSPLKMTLDSLKLWKPWRVWPKQGWHVTGLLTFQLPCWDKGLLGFMSTEGTLLIKLAFIKSFKKCIFLSSKRSTRPGPGLQIPQPHAVSASSGNGGNAATAVLRGHGSERGINRSHSPPCKSPVPLPPHTA